MRNTQCLKPTCIYDIDELYIRYEKSNYSSYTNFMCHTYFYLDEDLRKIVDVIWNTYNKFSLQCSKIAVFKVGSWEAVLPEYLKRMYRKNVEEYDVKQDDDDYIDQPDEILKFEQPLKNEFDVQEYAELLEQEDRGDEKLHDTDIILRRYNLQIKWKEFAQFKNQVAVSINIIGNFMHYLYYYLQVRKNTLKMQSNQVFYVQKLYPMIVFLKELEGQKQIIQNKSKSQLQQIMMKDGLLLFVILKQED